MVRKTLALAVLATGFSAFAAYASARNSIRVNQPVYSISLRGNTTVLAEDQPVARGSVLVFHRHPDGRLTSVPAEDVAAISSVAANRSVVSASTVTAVRSTSIRSIRRSISSAAPPAPVEPLQPGDAVILGPTGSAASVPSDAAAPSDPSASSAATAAAAPTSPSGAISAQLALEAQVFPGEIPVPGPAGNATATMVNGAPVNLYGGGGTGAGTVINPTLQANQAAAAAAAATAAATPPTIGPDGYPITGTPTAPAGGNQPINPNGFPATTTTGPQSGTQPVGPNGFPTLTTPSTGTSGATGTTGANAKSTQGAAAPASSSAH